MPSDKQHITDCLDVDLLIKVNEERRAAISAAYDPVVGIGSHGERFEFSLSDFPSRLYPEAMRNIPLVRALVKAGSIAAFIKGSRFTRADIMFQLVKIRIQHDPEFWMASFVKIKSKEGGGNVPFVLNNPQRVLLATFERMRLSGMPIRVIVLKARQWGGSTLTQMYMAWIQLVHRQGFYSAIVAHRNSAARNIRGMYRKMLRDYPPQLLGLPGKPFLSLSSYEGSATDVTISQGTQQCRDTVISIGSMQSPDGIRSGDIALVHYSEVGVWKKTDNRSPEEVVQSISSSILDAPLTMDVMESTAKGEDNLFHHEWLDAVDRKSAREPVFIAWFQIPRYSKEFGSAAERRAFCADIIRNRLQEASDSVREEPGKYIYWLWTLGATLEAINWYVHRRRTFRSHDTMASEFPSDSIEAFAHSGQKVFDKYAVEQLRPDCCEPIAIGECIGDGVEGKEAITHARFVPDSQGQLKIWSYPDTSFLHRHRYLVVCDVGGRSDKADFSDILVIDRWWRTCGEGDEIVAEWHGHCPHKRLAWKMAQIAAYYCDALLVVESNTFETKDNDTEGDHSQFILDQVGKVYPNMYAREASRDKIKEGRPTMWGWQTNRLTKPLIIDNLIAVIDEHAYTEHEAEALTEFNVYVRRDGVCEASDGYHDDRVMVRAIGEYISSKMPLPVEIAARPVASDLKPKGPVTAATM